MENGFVSSPSFILSTNGWTWSATLIISALSLYSPQLLFHSHPPVHPPTLSPFFPRPESPVRWRQNSRTSLCPDDRLRTRWEWRTLRSCDRSLPYQQRQTHKAAGSSS